MPGRVTLLGSQPTTRLRLPKSFALRGARGATRAHPRLRPSPVTPSLRGREASTVRSCGASSAASACAACRLARCGRLGRLGWVYGLVCQPLSEGRVQFAEVVGREGVVGDEMGDQHGWIAAEHLLDQAGDGATAGGPLPNERKVSVRLAFPFVPNESLRLEIPQDREDGRVGEVGGKAIADFGHGGRAGGPENAHDVELAVAEFGGHCRDSYYDGS